MKPGVLQWMNGQTNCRTLISQIKFSNKNEGIVNTCNNMDKCPGNYIECKTR